METQIKGVLAGARKLRELISSDVKTFEKDDEYFIVGISESPLSCSERSEIIDKVLDEAYKYANSLYLTVLIVNNESYKQIRENLGKEID
ncbi:hypothetical protein [Candidatus Acidianus copahuensis]|uniref:hypothetical protein n=1 Tax=Candidatus Acidianus copahuensis TaxID=1160895 RepID=UPI000694FF28|nr:hypothetical protein [Candidatus Acidianus copahuensis]